MADEGGDDYTLEIPAEHFASSPSRQTEPVRVRMPWYDGMIPNPSTVGAESTGDLDNPFDAPQGGVVRDRHAIRS